MAEKTKLSAADAEKEAVAAIDKNTTTKITLEKQPDGTWTATVLP